MPFLEKCDASRTLWHHVHVFDPAPKHSVQVRLAHASTMGLMGVVLPCTPSHAIAASTTTRMDVHMRAVSDET